MGASKPVKLTDLGLVSLIIDESPIYDASFENRLFQHMEWTGKQFLDATVRRIKNGNGQFKV